MTSLRKLVATGLLVGLATAFGAETSALPSWKRPSIDLESGVLWEVGTSTPIPYRLVPTQLSWRSAEVFGWDVRDGMRLLVRNRFTLIGTWVQQGPESHYVAVAASPSVEFWNRKATWGLVGGAGGGFGLIDSRGVKGGQGQDFTLNWFARGALEHVTPTGRRFSVGIFFQHMSNGGQTKPNPGINALGFALGYSWQY